MKYLEEIDSQTPEFGDLYDELPLWSAPIGLMLLEQVPMRKGMTILDVGAGTGFLAALEHRLNALAAERGEMSLTIPAACIHACKSAAE